MKVKILFGVMALVLSTMGIVVMVRTLLFSTALPTAPDNMVSTMMERPIDGDITTLTPNENLYVAAGELYRAGSFLAVGSGQTVSMGVSQAIASRRTVVGNDVFKEAVSYSGFVKMGEQRYVRGDSDYIIRYANKVNSIDNIDWSNDATPISGEQYLSMYGYVPTGLSGYILNDSTIVSSELVEVKDNQYTFHYVLDSLTAGYYILNEMRYSAGTEEYPEFSKAEIYVTMTADWQVVSLSTDCEYVVAMLGGVNCKENLTEYFYDIGSVTEVENTDFFEPYFGAETEDVVTKVDPLTELMNIFQPYINGQPLNVSFNASFGDLSNKTVSGKLNLLLDIENTDNIVANASIDGIADISYKKGKLYVARDEFKGSVSVDGIMGAVGTITELLGGGGIDFGGIDLDGLLEGLKADKGDDYCKIILDTELMGLPIYAEINAKIANGNYTLTSVTASVAGVNLELAPCAAFDVLDTSGNYPDMLGLLDIIEGGVLAFDVSLNNMLNAHIQYDIKAGTLNAHLGDIYLLLKDDNIYLTYGAIKLKLALSDIGKLSSDVTALLESLGVNAGLDFDLGELGLDDIIQSGEVNIDAILGGIGFVGTSDRAELSVTLGKIAVAIVLNVVDNKWTFGEVNASMGDIAISAEKVDVEKYPEVNGDEYVNVKSVVDMLLPAIQQFLAADSFGVDIGGKVAVGNKAFDFKATININKAGNAFIDFDVIHSGIAILNGEITIVNGKLYIDFCGIKTAIDIERISGLMTGSSAAKNSENSFDLTQISDILADMNPVLGEIAKSILPVVDKLTNISLESIDFGNIVNKLAFENGILVLGINGSQFGFGDNAEIQLSYNNALNLSLENISVEAVNLDANAVITTGVKISAPNAEDYLLNLNVQIGDYNAVITVDLLNEKVLINAELFGETLYAKLEGNVIYINYGNLKLKFNLADTGTVMSYLKEYLNFDISSGAELDLKELLSGIKINLTADNPNISAELFGIPVVINLVSVDNALELGDINLSVSGLNIKVAFTDNKASDFNVDNTYIDAIDAFLPVFDRIVTLMTSKAFTADLDVTLAVEGNALRVVGTVNYNNGIEINADIYANNLKVLKANIIILDGVLYLKANNIALAFNLNTSGGNSSTLNSLNIDTIKTALEKITGINEHLDSLIVVISNLLDKVASKDLTLIPKLIKSLTYDGGISLVINGEVLGTSDLNLVLNAKENLKLTVNEWQIGNITLAAKAGIVASSETIKVNPEEYQLNLIIKLDEVNTLYANINTLTNVYRFKMGELYAEYSESIIKISYKDIALQGNISELTEIFNELSELANSRLFEGVDIPSGEEIGGLGGLFNLDIMAVLKSLNIEKVGENYQIGISLMGINATAIVNTGDSPVIEYISLPLLGKDILVTVDNHSQSYIDFSRLTDIVAIEDVFNDYFPVLKDLMLADGWQFNIETELSLGQDKYQLANGSVVNFQYRNKDDFSVSADLIINKWDGTAYNEFIKLKVAYIDSRIYIDYNGLKITIHKDALTETLALYDDLVRVIPMIGDIVDEMLGAMSEAEGNAQTMDYSKILTAASYDGGVFKLGIDGSVLVSKLGEILLEFSCEDSLTNADGSITPQGLKLGIQNLTYDNFTIHSLALSVRPQASEYFPAKAEDYPLENYFNLDSLYQLLSSFITTADNNSFHIAGTVNASLISIAKVNIGIDLYVDIDEDGYANIALQISRERIGYMNISNIAFNDYGGNSYLFYDGRNDTVTIFRDSCDYDNSGWNFFNPVKTMKQNDYYVTIDTKTFMSGIVDYLMEMINFKQWIRDEITGAVNSEGSGNSYGIEDIWTGYSYTSTTDGSNNTGGQFDVSVNLEPIDSALGVINIQIGHDGGYNLTYLNGDASLLSGMCDITFALNHKTPERYGIANDYVSVKSHWKGTYTTA